VRIKSSPRDATLMKSFFRNLSLLLAEALLLSWTSLNAQTNPVSPRITQSVEEAQLVRLQGNVHPLAQAKYDQGAVSDGRPMNRMLLLLQHSEEQEVSLKDLLNEQQEKSSANYHHWLMPEEFGRRFGPADSDIQVVTDWLTSRGFQGIKVGAGRVVIEFSGTAGQVRKAFHMEIHNYLVNDEEHFANSSDLRIPAALAPVVAGVVSLHNFPKQSLAHRLGTFKKIKSTGEVQPEFTYINCGSTGTLPCYAVGPSDFGTMYNVRKLWDAGIDGTGQSIAIVGQTNLNLRDVRDFRKMFGLPANDPQGKELVEVILNGPDPGIISKNEETEADLDVEWSGAVAKNATIKFVVSESTPSSSTAGVDLSALYIVDNNIAPVMSESYGACELYLGSSGNKFFKGLWQQAAAQGITVIISAGDNGTAACDAVTGTKSATHGLAVSGLASTPYNVALGGTDFYYTSANPATNYWNGANDSGTGLSAKSYIPETTWNNSCAQSGALGCNSVQNDGRDIVAGGGGQSNCSTLDSGGTCTAGYAKPDWQSGTGVPTDSVRDIPDVSLFSGSGANNSFYIVCQADQVHDNSCSLTSGSLSFVGVGGTSAAAPAFAGIMAMVNQKTAARQGNANYVLYKLAATQNPSNCNATTGSGLNCIFNDVTVGSNSVACTGGSPNCSASTGYGVLVDPKDTSMLAWTTTNGYDRATGLGSVNAYNLVQDWSAASFTGTSTNLTLNSGTAVNITHGRSVPVQISVSPNSGSGTPTGDVSLIANLSNSPAGIGLFTLSSGTASGSTNALPGGTYTVTAHYAGDGTNAASGSNAVSVAVTQENSKTAVSLVTFSSSGSVSNSNATSAPYGSPYILRVDVTDNAGQKCSSATVSCPSGSVTLTDNGTSLDNGTYVLNSGGYFEDQAVQLNAGSHPIAAKYAGDNSYSGSTSAANTITISQSSTTAALTSSSTSIHSGDSVTLTAIVSTDSSAGAPTGTVQFYRGSSVISGTVAYSAVAGSSTTGAYLKATLTTTLSSGLAPIGEMPRRSELPKGPALWLVCGFVALLIRVLWNGQAKRSAYASAALFLFAAAATSFAGCSGAPGKSASITAKYSGDTNYKSSTSSVVTIKIQ
jgi:subtilase family serine protease